MAKTIVATLQTPSTCRWSRPGFRLSGVEELLQPESLWVCIRRGRRQDVSNPTCESCPHWKLEEYRSN
jgi:hypothetical protein